MRWVALVDQLRGEVEQVTDYAEFDDLEGRSSVPLLTATIAFEVRTPARY